MGCRETHGVRSTVRAVNARVAAGGICALLLCMSPEHRASAQDPAPNAAPEYEDQLIEGGNLTPDVSDDMYAGHDSTGWPRSFRIQFTTSSITRGNVQSSETGFQFGGMLDTPNYGAFSVDASLRASNDDNIGSGGLFTLWQRGLPMDGGWFGNNALGVFNTINTDVARQQYRFYLPTIATAGAATEWRQDGKVQLQAAIGEPGLYTGLYVPGFEGLGGRIANGGLSWRLSNEWSAAVQMVDVDNARLGIGPNALPGTISAQSWYGGMAWATSSARAQLNVVDSDTQGDSNRVGAWLDAGIRSSPRLTHSFGAFYLNPNLVWGNQPLASNLEGGYYRAAFQSRRWIVDGGVDYVMPVSGPGDTTVYGTGNVRYQYLTGLGVGGGGNVLHGATDAWSVFAFVDHANPLGLGRVQANYATDDQQNSTQLSFDQTWKVPAAMNVSTSLILGSENFGNASGRSVGVAVYGGLPLRGTLRLDANARWDKGFGDLPSENVLANIALNWGFAAGWIASLNYYASRNTGQAPFTVTSPIPTFTPVVQAYNDRSVFLSVRYDWRAGSASAPIGGAAGGGSGSVWGVLFLDANDNGRLDAGEAAAQNVTVLLDGRFTVRTDNEGRFEFPAVAPGNHVVTVLPDNLPLPWVVSSGGRFDVQVRVRDQSRIEIPAQRLR
jgi:hypothetical protein